MAEKRAPGPGRQHQVVIAVGLAVEDDLLSLGVHLGDLAEQHLHVALLSDQFTQWGGDIPPGDQASGDLIEQRLEQVEVAFIDQGDPDIGLGECLTGMDPCETSPNDHHVGGVSELFGWGLQFQKKMVASHRRNQRSLPEGYGDSTGLSVGASVGIRST